MSRLQNGRLRQDFDTIGALLDSQVSHGFTSLSIATFWHSQSWTKLQLLYNIDTTPASDIGFTNFTCNSQNPAEVIPGAEKNKQHKLMWRWKSSASTNFAQNDGYKPRLKVRLQEVKIPNHLFFHAFLIPILTQKSWCTWQPSNLDQKEGCVYICIYMYI